MMLGKAPYRKLGIFRSDSNWDILVMEELNLKEGIDLVGTETRKKRT